MKKIKEPKIKEPDFMQQLHNIRERLSMKWDKMTTEEVLNSLHESGKWLKTQMRPRSFK